MLTQEGKVLLERVCKEITEHASRFDMTSWFRVRNGYSALSPIHSCGTTACIAGWVCSLKFPEGKPDMVDEPDEEDIENGWLLADLFATDTGGEGSTTVELLARLTLGLDAADAYRLFFLGGWPLNMMQAYFKAESQTEKAAIAVDRIQHFIKTGE